MKKNDCGSGAAQSFVFSANGHRWEKKKFKIHWRQNLKTCLVAHWGPSTVISFFVAISYQLPFLVCNCSAFGLEGGCFC
jgi:hypothetical protein